VSSINSGFRQGALVVIAKVVASKNCQPPRIAVPGAQFVEQWTIAGPPKECVAQLRAYYGAGLGHMALRLASWKQQAQLERFLGEVAPALGER